MAAIYGGFNDACDALWHRTISDDFVISLQPVERTFTREIRERTC